MRIYEIIKILTEGIPKTETWPVCANEPYGVYNIIENIEVKRILYCVTATEDVVTYFKENKYDLLISHHPFIVDVPQFICHTALDCCKDGLNDIWKDYLGIKDAMHFDANLGWCGDIEPINFFDLIKKITDLTGEPIFNAECNDYNKINGIIDNIVLCTGLGGAVQQQAFNTGSTCYIVGEGNMYLDFPAYIEIGHTLSEQVGIITLKVLLQNVIIDLAPLDVDYFNVDEFDRFCLKKEANCEEGD